jgi:heavy metal translocating P-type ATPase
MTGQTETAFLPRLARFVERATFPAMLLLLAAGGLFHVLGLPQQSDICWQTGTALALAVLAVDIAYSAVRGEFALDVIAAIAMASALALGESLAGMIVAVMYSGGETLERFAQGRVSREMNALLARVPRSAMRYSGKALEEVAVEALCPGDRVLVRRGEVVPVDGSLVSPVAMVDESTLTGEALPVRRAAGAGIMSGSTNAGDAFELRVERSSAESTYSGIVRLVAAARNQKSRIMRVADRYALLFLAVTLAVAGAAWLLAGDPSRALAVLVVATPCPLILAVPAAILSGVSHCARKGILVKGGEALERLADIRVALLDKTGTVTDGRARLIETRTLGDWPGDELLRLAASLDQSSPHVIAQALVAEARERAMDLEPATEVRETAGSGLTGMVGDRQVTLGGIDFVASRCDDPAPVLGFRSVLRNGLVVVAVAIDRRAAGLFILADRLRPETPTVLRQLRTLGISRIVLLTGDDAGIAAGIGAYIEADEVLAEMRPEQKAAAVEAAKVHGKVMMIGDGVNDAPALAAADVGVAMGARGAAASSEAADVVILVDRLDRIVRAIVIARRTRGIAIQSAVAGIGLSVVAMLAAMLGHLPAIQGALVQEAIDVLVIVNALRALGEPLLAGRGGHRMSAETVHNLEEEHRQLADVVEAIRGLADGVNEWPDQEIRLRLADLNRRLIERLLPHEQNDDRIVYAGIRRNAGDADALTGMSRGHLEIRRIVYDLEVFARTFAGEPIGSGEKRALQRQLDALEAVTRLHFAQEEEIYRAIEAR